MVELSGIQGGSEIDLVPGRLWEVVAMSPMPSHFHVCSLLSFSLFLDPSGGPSFLLCPGFSRNLLGLCSFFFGLVGMMRLPFSEGKCDVEVGEARWSAWSDDKNEVSKCLLLGIMTDRDVEDEEHRPEITAIS